jgi:hypothetical protein
MIQFTLNNYTKDKLSNLNFMFLDIYHTVNKMYLQHKTVQLKFTLGNKMNVFNAKRCYDQLQ